MYFIFENDFKTATKSTFLLKLRWWKSGRRFTSECVIRNKSFMEEDSKKPLSSKDMQRRRWTFYGDTILILPRLMISCIRLLNLLYKSYIWDFSVF
jgi:hypothetical protein